MATIYVYLPWALDSETSSRQPGVEKKNKAFPTRVPLSKAKSLGIQTGKSRYVCTCYYYTFGIYLYTQKLILPTPKQKGKWNGMKWNEWMNKKERKWKLVVSDFALYTGSHEYYNTKVYNSLFYTGTTHPLSLQVIKVELMADVVGGKVRETHFRGCERKIAPSKKEEEKKKKLQRSFFSQLSKKILCNYKNVSLTI